MLDLGDAFGYSDILAGASCPLDLSQDIKTLIDLRDERLAFTPQEIADTVRSTANGIYDVFHKHLEATGTLSVKHRAIALVLPQGCESLFAFLGVAGLSSVACPMYPVLSTREYIFAFKDLGVQLLLVSGDGGNPGAEKAAKELKIPTAYFSWNMTVSPPRPIIGDRGSSEEAPTRPDLIICPKEFDVCAKIHTAGTTDRPKVVTLTHRNIVLSLANIQKTYVWNGYSGAAFSEGPQDLDVGLCVTPLCHVHGLIAACLAPLAAQSIVCISPNGFDVSTFWRQVVDNKVTWLTLIPNMLVQLLDEYETTYPKNESPSLRFIRTTSSPLSVAIAKKAEIAFKTTILEAYSLTEAAHQICSNGHPSIEDHLLGSVGKPTGTEVCILKSGTRKVTRLGEAGDIWIRGWNVTDRYENMSEEQQEAEFLQHNDVDWFGCSPLPPSFYSTAFDLSPGLHRSFSSSSSIVSNIPRRSEPSLIPADLMPPPTESPTLLIPQKCGNLVRVASALEPYVSSEFPERDEPLVSPLPLQARWLRTGDTGLMLKDGRLQIIARSKDVINRAGVKVSPYEIESVYVNFEGVQEACAFGLEHSVLGEVVAIALVMEAGKPLEDSIIREFEQNARQSLAYFKVPDEVFEVKALPRDTDGRILRDALSSKFSAEHKRAR